MEELIDGLPKYVVNFDEFIRYFGNNLVDLIDSQIKDKYPQISTDNLKSLLDDIKELLPNEKYVKIQKDIDLVIKYSTLYGIPKIEGRLIDVPPIVQNVLETFKFEKDVYITGLHLNQTGWKKEDVYSLLADKKILVDNISTKEIGEHKYLNTPFEVKATAPITFILNNKSGNSRQTMMDLEYIEKIEPPIPPTPTPVPNWGDIKDHDWDIGIKLTWEPDIDTDIDIHLYLIDSYGKEDAYANYKNRTLPKKGLYIDFDCQSHLIEKERPEIASIDLKVNDNKNKILKIYINHFRGPLLTKPATIQICKNNKSYEEIKKYNVTVDSSYINSKVGVCTINLNDLSVKDLINDRKPRS